MKRLLCLILALLMVFSLLAGCAGKDDKDDEEEKDSTTDVQKDDKNEDKNEDDKPAVSIPSAPAATVSIVGFWNMDTSEMGEIPGEVVIEKWGFQFNSNGTGAIVGEMTVNGEPSEDNMNVPFTYSVSGNELTMISEEGEEEVCKFTISGNVLEIITSDGVTIKLTK